MNAQLSRLCDYAGGLDWTTLDGAVRSRMRACLLYGLAVGIATTHVKASQLATATLDWDRAKDGAGVTGTGPATRFLDGERASVADAAMANAVLLSGRAQGDSHAAGHIGGVVIPAVLAVAQQSGLSGKRTGEALVAGYETALRIGRHHAPDLSARGFRTTPAYGVIGAAVGAARALDLGSHGVRTALSLAVNFSGGLREYVRTGTREAPFQAGMAARNGVTCAGIVQQGLNEAAPAALYGEAGFFQAFGKPGVDYGHDLATGLGEQFEFTTVTYKPYPACQFLRGMIAGIAQLRETAAGGDPPEEIEVRMHPFEADFVGVRSKGPFRSTAQTLMSAPFCAALAWATGTVTLADLERFDDPAINTLTGRVTIIADPTRKKYHPAMTVRLADGRVLNGAASDDMSYAIEWGPVSAMTQRLFAEAGATDAQARQLIGLCEQLDDLPDIQPIIDAVVAATATARLAR